MLAGRRPAGKLILAVLAAPGGPPGICNASRAAADSRGQGEPDAGPPGAAALGDGLGVGDPPGAGAGVGVGVGLGAEDVDARGAANQLSSLRAAATAPDRSGIGPGHQHVSAPPPGLTFRSATGHDHLWPALHLAGSGSRGADRR